LLNLNEDSYESQLPLDLQSALVEAHAARGAEDPHWLLASGNLAANRGEFATATATFQQGLKQVPNSGVDESDVAYALQSALNSTLLCLPGGWKVAYESAADPEEQFDNIGRELEAHGRWTELRELVELHRAR